MPLAANPRHSRFDKMNIPTRAAWIRTLRRELHRSLQYGLLSGTAAIAEMQRKKKKRIIPDTLMYTEGFGGGEGWKRRKIHLRLSLNGRYNSFRARRTDEYEYQVWRGRCCLICPTRQVKEEICHAARPKKRCTAASRTMHVSGGSRGAWAWRPRWPVEPIRRSRPERRAEWSDFQGENGRDTALRAAVLGPRREQFGAEHDRSMRQTVQQQGVQRCPQVAIGRLGCSIRCRKCSVQE